VGEFTYLVFLVVASLVATLVTVFAAGVGAVLMYSPGDAPHGEDHARMAAPAAERYAA
jgi:hypothetical protein